MIKTYSDDPDVKQAAEDALDAVNEVLESLPKATSFDYGGHALRIGEYDVCVACTMPIAEAQAAEQAILIRAEDTEDATVREHLETVAKLFHAEAQAAILRAEFHNGNNTEEILNRILGFAYERHIGEDYHHSHHGGHE